MSGKNLPLLDIPPGVFRENSEFATAGKWWNANLVRWANSVLIPVGGWVVHQTISGPAQPIRTMFSWRDNSKQAWTAHGSADKVVLVKEGETPTQNDITPGTLAWSPGTAVGFGSGGFGGAFGKDQPDTGGATISTDALWSFDAWGENLVGVHSQDGRLLQWVASTPTTDLVAVAGAPTDNRLVVVTDERFVMLLGGVNHPRRVKWCSRENITDWTATETNSAGGFELDSHGEITAAMKVPNGILVFTDTDVHLIEYSGAPFQYGRRRITDSTGIVSQQAVAPTPGGCVWLGQASFWRWDGNIIPLPCTVSGEVFYNSTLSRKVAVFMGTNEMNQEVWLFYPDKSSGEANRYALFSYKAQPFWSIGEMQRTAMLRPVFQPRPLMAKHLTVYEHEVGWDDAGTTRSVFAETGDIALNNADQVMHVDRIWPDAVAANIVGPVAMSAGFPYEIDLKLREAPRAATRNYGPVTFNTDKGYSVIRFRARLASIKVRQVVDTAWGVGKLMVRTKLGGRR